MVQLTLFDRKPKRRRSQACHSGPAAGPAATSQAAAESMRGEPSARQRQQVLDELLRCGQHGATREELGDLTGLKIQSVCGRVNELLRSGAVCERGTRPTRSNRSAAVVVAVGS